MNSKNKIFNIHILMLTLCLFLLGSKAYAAGNPLDAIETTSTSIATSAKSVAKAIIAIVFIIGVVVFVAKKGQVSIYATIILPLIGTSLIYGAVKLIAWASTAVNF